MPQQLAHSSQRRLRPTFTDPSLTEELARRAKIGQTPKSLSEIIAALDNIGYKLDRSSDCRCTARYQTGEWAGASYPCTTCNVIEKDSGQSFANIHSRRDKNFKTLQDMRFSGEWFAIIRGTVFEI